MKKRSVLGLISTSIIFLIFLLLLWMYLVTKQEKVLILLYVSIAILFLSILTFCGIFFLEKNMLQPHQIGEYSFSPITRDDLSSLRELMFEEEKENSLKEANRLEKIFLQAKKWEKDSSAYLIKKNQKEIAILEFEKKKGKRIGGMKILYQKEPMEENILLQLLQMEGIVMEKEK